MASASDLANFPTNASYLPSFECLRRSRHSRSAIARISSSVFSMMFNAIVFNADFCLRLVVVDEVIAGRLLHGVLAGFRIAARNGQHVPVLVVHLHDVSPVVVTRPARLLAEQRVLRDALRGPMTVLELPRAQQLVNVLRGHALEVLLHELQLLEADIEELLVGHVADGIAA